MKKQKSVLTITLTAVLLFCMCFCFTGCNKNIQYNKEYKYCGVTFKKDKDLKLEDLNSFIPAGYDIKTVADFEKMFKDNIG